MSVTGWRGVWADGLLPHSHTCSNIYSLAHSRPFLPKYRSAQERESKTRQALLGSASTAKSPFLPRKISFACVTDPMRGASDERRAVHKQTQMPQLPPPSQPPPSLLLPLLLLSPLPLPLIDQERRSCCTATTMNFDDSRQQQQQEDRATDGGQEGKRVVRVYPSLFALTLTHTDSHERQAVKDCSRTRRSTVFLLKDELSATVAAEFALLLKHNISTSREASARIREVHDDERRGRGADSESECVCKRIGFSISFSFVSIECKRMIQKSESESDLCVCAERERESRALASLTTHTQHQHMTVATSPTASDRQLTGGDEERDS